MKKFYATLAAVAFGCVALVAGPRAGVKTISAEAMNLQVAETGMTKSATFHSNVFNKDISGTMALSRADEEMPDVSGEYMVMFEDGTGSVELIQDGETVTFHNFIFLDAEDFDGTLYYDEEYEVWCIAIVPGTVLASDGSTDYQMYLFDGSSIYLQQDIEFVVSEIAPGQFDIFFAYSECGIFYGYEAPSGGFRGGLIMEPELMPMNCKTTSFWYDLDDLTAEPEEDIVPGFAFMADMNEDKVDDALVVYNFCGLPLPAIFYVDEANQKVIDTGSVLWEYKGNPFYMYPLTEDESDIDLENNVKGAYEIEDNITTVDIDRAFALYNSEVGVAALIGAVQIKIDFPIGNIIEAESIGLSPKELYLKVGQVGGITAEVYPNDTTYPLIIWTSSDKDIATVNNGYVTAVGPGTAVITATCGKVFATCSVIVEDRKPQTINWDQDLNNIYEGQSVVLTAYSTSDLPISYEIIEGHNYATLNGNVLETICPGKVTIVASQQGNAEYAAAASVTRIVNIKVMEPEAIELSETTLHLTVGEQTTLSVKLTPDYPDLLPQIEWWVNNPEVATIENGVVTAISGGNTNVNVGCGSVYATCEVIVSKLPQEILWNQSFDDVHEGDVIELMACASSELPVEYEIIDGAQCARLEGDFLEISSIGLIAIKAMQPGNEVFEAADPCTISFSVTSSISNIKTSEAVLLIENNALMVYGLAKDQNYSVFNSTGLLIYKGHESIITLASGVYIVAVPGQLPQRIVVR